jgi:hypothetical protein
VLLYEMMTGRVPFQATTIGALCAQISNAEYPPLRQLNPAAPAAVEGLVSRCLKRSAAERYQSAEALLADVRRAADSLDAPPPQSMFARNRPARPPADPHAPPPPAAASSGSHPALGRGLLLAGGVAAVLLCLLVLGGAGLWYALSGTAAENVNASALKSRTGKTVKVEMSDGPAEIWQGDRLMGVGKADVTAEIGEWVELRLKRNGQERVERFQMTANRQTWTLTFNK